MRQLHSIFYNVLIASCSCSIKDGIQSSLEGMILASLKTGTKVCTIQSTSRISTSGVVQKRQLPRRHAL
jgi:hypothetical protein